MRRPSPGTDRSRPATGGRTKEPLPAGFFTIWSTVAIDLIGFGIVLPILPQYAERFGASPTTIGLMVASFSVAQLLCAPIWGRLSDRIGRKPLLVVSLFGTALGSLLTGIGGGIAGGLTLLFLGRILDGASGASVSVAQAAASDLAPPQERARLMGLLGAAFGVGFVLGPAIGAIGAKVGGPQFPFFLAAGIAFVNAIVAIFRLPETAPHREPAGAATDAERIAAAGAPDGPGLVEPAHHEAPDRSVGTTPAARKAILRLIVVSFVGMVAFSGFEATFSLLTERRFGLDLTGTGAIFTVIGIALVAVQGGLVGRVNQALGEHTTLRLALAANAVGFVFLAADGGWATLVPALAFLVAGQGLLTPTLSAAVAARAGRARGEWLGWQQSAGGLARVAGPTVAGILFEHAGAGVPYLLGAALAVAALALVPVLG